MDCLKLSPCTILKGREVCVCDHYASLTPQSVLTHLVIQPHPTCPTSVTRQEMVALSASRCSSCWFKTSKLLSICFEIPHRKDKFLVASFSSIDGHQLSVDCLRSLMSAKSNNIIVCFFFCKQDEDSWLHCTLCRSGRQGVSTLNKALLRQVEWPAQGNTSLHSMEVCLLLLMVFCFNVNQKFCHAV